MPIVSAQNNFKRGLAALVDDNPRDAVVFFGRALEIQDQRLPGHPEGRCLSYYGLSLAMLSPNHPDALKACRAAADENCADPELFLNLGRACLLNRRRTEALRAFQRGLELDATHPVLRRELRQVERRRDPVLARLDRDHPVNVWLGRFRANWVSPSRPEPSATNLLSHH